MVGHTQADAFRMMKMYCSSGLGRLWKTADYSTACGKPSPRHLFVIVCARHHPNDETAAPTGTNGPL